LIYQFYIALVDSDPPIWRGFHTPSTLSLPALHRLINAVMGWAGEEEPYSFRVGEQRYDGYGSSDGLPLKETILAEVVPPQPKTTLLYTYGTDGWLHKLALDQVFALTDIAISPACIGGEYACPPLHCGGVWGYAELLERLNDPEDPDFHQLWDQVGPNFDPDRFDLAAVNQTLTESFKPIP